MRVSTALVLTLGLGFGTPALAALGSAKTEDVSPPALKLEPTPHMTPRQVLEIQLRALAANAEWGRDRGIALTFRFASPGNQRQTGPLPRFARMVKGRVYGPLVDHREARIGPTQLVDGRALIPVDITAADGTQHPYAWVLGRQTSGAHRDCWLTDAVVPLGDGPEEAARGTEI